MGHKQEDPPDAPGALSPERGIRHQDKTHVEGIDRASPGQTFDQALSLALADNRIADARTIVATAESDLHASRSPRQWQTETIGIADLAAAKARIAMAIGDLLAARAILIQAIEANPKTASLKALMTEVMMADGRATDVRPILRHLGGDTTRRNASDASSDCSEPEARDTSA